ncbi:hypothetical protein [Streptomyces sp. NPDC005538]|uniref:hypothetical protein n=1 Tax=unclassified Streptomyces TaxID=2593676 RepID=UPI0033B15C78
MLLVALNAYFEGQSTGETLNGKGKTDILIRVGDRNVSISECKFYTGPKSVTDALDQLLRYTDNGGRRTSLLMFYREQDPDARIADTIAAIRSHPQCESFDSSRADEDGSGVSLSGAAEIRAVLPVPRWRSSPSSSPDPYQDFKIIPWRLLASPWLDPYGTM